MLGLAVVTAAWFVAMHVAGADAGLLYLTPCLLLAVLLFGGVYPAEQALARRIRSPRRRPPGRAPRPRHIPTEQPRGGLVLARRLAGRAPPLRRRQWMQAT
jgi:hypothetical protein